VYGLILYLAFFASWENGKDFYLKWRT
jgi:hypothetical protein